MTTIQNSSCKCSGCDEWSDDKPERKRQMKNKHCHYCQCISCVCDYRVKNKLYHPKIEKYNWDSLCSWKACPSCELQQDIEVARHYHHSYKLICSQCGNVELLYDKKQLPDVVIKCTECSK